MMVESRSSYPAKNGFSRKHEDKDDHSLIMSNGALSAPILGCYGKSENLGSAFVEGVVLNTNLPKLPNISALQLEDAIGSSLASAIDNLDLSGKNSMTGPKSDMERESSGRDFLPHLAFDSSYHLRENYFFKSESKSGGYPITYCPDYINSYTMPMSAPPHPQYTHSFNRMGVHPSYPIDRTSHQFFMTDFWTRKIQSDSEIEILPFCLNEETHCLVLVRVELIPLSKLSSACQAHGSIYYLRTEYHSRGIVFLSYLDKRSTIQAFNELPRELRLLGATSVSVRYSVSLHASSFYHDCKILLCDIPIGVDDITITRICQSLGDVHKLHLLPNSDKLFYNVAVDFYDISDAQLAVQNMNLNPPRILGRSFNVKMSIRSNEERERGSQLLSLLSSWQIQRDNRKSWRNGSSLSNMSDSEGSIDSVITSTDVISTINAVQPEIETPIQMSNSLIHTDNKTSAESNESNGKNSSSDVPHRYRYNCESFGQCVVPMHFPKVSPREKEYDLDLNRIVNGIDKRTTIMIRNIPNKYTQMMLLDEVDKNYRGTYDFFYLPIDFKNKCNVGYAFINFMDPHQIINFTQEFDGQRWGHFNSEKICAITYARIQGKNSMISRFQNSSLMEKECEYRPLIFHSSGPDKGRPETFPTGNRQRRGNYHNSSAVSYSR